MKGKKMSKFGVLQRVKLQHSHSPGNTGTILGVEIFYVIKEDGGLTFRHPEEGISKLDTEA